MTVLVRVSLGTSVCNMEHGVNQVQKYRKS